MFSWIPIYAEIAHRVLEFEGRQAELIDLLVGLQKKGHKVGYFNDYDVDGNQFPLAEMDPFTFFSTFNRNQAVGTRIAIVEAIKNEWGLDAPVPQDFDGIPQANAQNSWYFSYKKNREPHAVALLWRAAREACSSTFRNYDAKLFDETLDVRFVGFAKLTFGLFWLNPRGFLCYDANTRDSLSDSGVAPATAKNAAGYFDWVNRVVQAEGDDFPQISFDAYETGPVDGLTEESRDNDQGTRTPKTWIMSLGSRGEMWEDCLRAGIVALGWDELGDLRQYADKEEIRERLQANAGVTSSKSNSTLACWQFANSIQPGDVIFAKGGATTVLGLGIVTGDYEFDETRPRFKHVRSVDWQLSGEWELPDAIRHPLKTLTDISRLPRRLSVMHETVGRAAPEPTARIAEEPPRDGVAYWWLNANPAIWDLRSGEIGSLQTYTTHNEAGNKRRVFKYFLQANPGDLIIGYSTSPDREIVSICEVTQGVHVADGKERIEFRKIEQLTEPVTYEELKAAPGLARCEPIVSNHQGSLFCVTPAEFEIIRALIDDHVAGQKSTSVLPFSKADALEDLFMGEDVLDATLARIRRKKAVILQGPPGVGKTFVAKRLAFAHMGEKDEQRVAMVQFHPSYAYEDFVQGYRPSERGLERRDGVFYRFVRLARNNPDKDWFFIIDEINRGNLAKIFGELLMLIEADKRGQRHAIPLTYSESAAETFHLPENLYFIGTMNTADRSLAMVDYALRRRFSFVTLQPELDSKAFGQWLKGRGAGDGLVDRIKRRVGEVNKVIAQERDLGSGFQIGHSFFCPPEGARPDQAWYEEVVQGEIKPLLDEYFESRDRVNGLVKDLLA
jgi:5-methylcytosine-specific restriction protein B